MLESFLKHFYPGILFGTIYLDKCNPLYQYTFDRNISEPKHIVHLISIEIQECSTIIFLAMKIGTWDRCIILLPSLG